MRVSGRQPSGLCQGSARSGTSVQSTLMMRIVKVHADRFKMVKGRTTYMYIQYKVVYAVGLARQLSGSAFCWD